MVDELWEHRIDEMLDRKLKPINKNLQSLKQTNDIQAKNLLETIRDLARLQIRITHNETITHVSNKNNIFSQFVAELQAASKDIDTSPNPMSVADKFFKKRWEDLENMGIKPIHID